MRFVQASLLKTAWWLSRVALRFGEPPAEAIESAVSSLVRRDRLARDPGVEESLGRNETPAGYLEMTARGQLSAGMGSAIILANERAGLFVPIFVGPTEALALGHRLEGTAYARPLPYDLIDHLLTLMSAEVDHVRIEELSGNVFIAAVVVRTAAKESITIDARASDAVIIALGHGLPVLVSDAVVATVARPLSSAP